MRVLKSGGRVVIVELYAPEKWRSLSGKIFMPIFLKLFFMHKKEMKAEKEPKLLTLKEWEALAIEMGAEDIQIEKFPNISEPEWKPGKMIISWGK
jgi:ubiquinone/menaquinone biosynthesis C-methylase UbiE